MPEPFKNKFNSILVLELAKHLERAAGASAFDRSAFVESATSDLDQLTLKQRSLQITRALADCLPSDFCRACEIVQAVMHPDENAPLAEQVMDEHGVRGWAIMPLADFVATHGLQQFDLSMHMLAHLTKRFTAEFAVRSFIIKDLQQALIHLRAWAEDDNVHLRRLASEGSRPRLPWGIQIPSLIADPLPLLPVLERLRDDPCDYVRKSVANHLNDVAKDHPSVVVDVARRWLVNAPSTRQRLVRHACRTLVKQGRQDILQLMGIDKAVTESVDFGLAPQDVTLGDAVELVVQITSSSAHSQELLLDYIVHFRLANGRVGKKVYKWKRLTLPAGEAVQLRKQHPLRSITTRIFYSGLHRIELQLNGHVVAERTFNLQVPPQRSSDALAGSDQSSSSSDIRSANSLKG